MGEEDLTAMLGLDDAVTAGATAPLTDALSGMTRVEAAREVQAGPYALALDAWGKRRGRELAGTSELLIEKGVDEFAAADFLAAAFDPEPKLALACTDALRREYMEQLMSTGDFADLHDTTMLNADAADMAAHSFARGYLDLRAEVEKAEAKAKAAGKMPGAGGGAGRGKGPGGSPGKAPGTEFAAMRHAARARRAARDEVDGAAEAASALGALDGKPSAALAKKIRSSRTLAEILKHAGRFIRVAASKQRQKAVHGTDEVVGVTLGGELARLIPSELCQLAEDELELPALRRLADREAMVRDHRATEPVGKGPIVVVVDESGSMSGAKIQTAKALALALGWIARRQNRWVAYVSFSGGTTGEWVAFPPGRWDQEKLIGWLEHFYSGGTILDVPLVELPTVYWPEMVKAGLQRGRTDVLMITDAKCHAPAEMVTKFNAWRAAEKVRVTTFVVQGRPGDLAKVSDDLHVMDAINPDSDAVGAVLSC